MTIQSNAKFGIRDRHWQYVYLSAHIYISINEQSNAQASNTIHNALTEVQESGNCVADVMSELAKEHSAHLSEVLLSAEKINKRVIELGGELSQRYNNLHPVLVVVLKGSYIFAADLSRAIHEPHEVEFVRATSYEGTQSSGDVRIQGLENVSLKGRHVLVVEDIVDTGLTLKTLLNKFQNMGAKSVKCCTFLRKVTTRRHADTPHVDFFAFEIQDKFVVGYGLDVDQRFRHLPFVGVYKPS